MLKLPSELELILHNIRGASLKDFKPDPDFSWKFFAELVSKHKLQTIVDLSQIPEMPQRVKEKIKTLVLTTNMQNLLQLKTVGELIREFAKHRIRVLFVKGVTISSLYPDFEYTRPAVDVDFIIDYQDVEKVSSILKELGFNLLGKTYKKTDGSLDFRHKDSNLLLELHWSLWSKREEIPSNFEKLWREREYITKHHIKIPVINHLTHVTYLCYHGTAHFWYRLFWLLDIYLLLKTDINWKNVEDNARINGTLPALHLALALARDLFGAELPDEINLKINKGMQNEIYQVLKDNPRGTQFEPKTLKDKLKRVSWKLRSKSKYRLRTIIKLLLIR